MTKPKITRTLSKTGFLIGGVILMLATQPELEAAQTTGYGSSDLYRADELSLDLFGTASLGKYSIENVSGQRIRHDTRLGAGVGLNYFMTRNLGIGADAYSENTSGTFVDSASANVIARFPLGDGGFAPSVMGGAGREFDSKLWFVQLGAGMEYRFAPTVSVFVDARWVLPEETKYHGVGRLGLRFAF